MKKQTAVEWLIEDLNQKIDFIPMDKWDMIRDIVHQALSMERDQIIDAYIDGYSAPENLGDSEQYYTSTFGS
jgi:hypothetical protein